MQNDIDDETLKAAIIACRPFVYLEDLKKRVAAHLGRPELYTGERNEFGMRVYRISGRIDREETQARIAGMGFREADTEMLESFVGRKVEMLMGVGGIFGEHIQKGTIKPNGRGGYLFIPKGSRTKGYVATYLRLETGDTSGLARSVIVVQEG
ncbi:hypothetical protein TA3x_000415 [Tundrisphaera sp. TA3]|uniref:hypothetical protein n=1 Tax=Tundrisphaera sp. TA3 TaxID=3435775 RepID=UPI003EBF1087